MSIPISDRHGLADILDEDLQGLSWTVDPTTFGGQRDLYRALGYKRKLTFTDYSLRYRRNEIAHRLVNIFPEYTWSPVPFLYDNTDPDIATTWEQEILSFVTRLRLWKHLKSADILASLDSYSVILIGAPGDLHTELPKGLHPSEIAYLRVFSRPRAPITAKYDNPDRDRDNPRFGFPKEYTLRITDKDRRKVHWSRIIHITEGSPDSELTARPLMERAWNRFDDYEKVVGGGSEAAWMRADPGMLVTLKPPPTKPGQPIRTLNEESVERLRTQVKEFKHDRERTLFMKNAEAREMYGQVFPFDTNANVLINFICASYGIPRGVFVGQEIGELFTSQDRFMWAKRIRNRRTSPANDWIEQVINRLIEYGVQGISMPADGKYGIFWTAKEELTWGEKAKIVRDLAAANEKEEYMSPGEVRENVLDLDPNGLDG